MPAQEDLIIVETYLCNHGNRLKCPRLDCQPACLVPIRVIITPYRFIPRLLWPMLKYWRPDNLARGHLSLLHRYVNKEKLLTARLSYMGHNMNKCTFLVIVRALCPFNDQTGHLSQLSSYPISIYISSKEVLWQKLLKFILGVLAPLLWMHGYQYFREERPHQRAHI